ncbi:unnamed protein product [Angiostrongylus costaricensis]|uniref:Prospero domain-containing protein n=1 Tax=Angiostrongylus costaricensis TaxID=334426 RepID=A0A0R3PPC7_ANGCS|nr:unnamed protein product [Angiostrongylus costaricensis]
MDKFARQALAEGITSREDIVVTMDSEIFRTLNQHYNRNNHVQPPESLVNVVQESLREFFDAIRLGKDAEPSWKKQIYKVRLMNDVVVRQLVLVNFIHAGGAR